VISGADSPELRAEAPIYKTGESWTYPVGTKYFETSTSRELLNGDYEIIFKGGKRLIFSLDGNGRTPLERSAGILGIMLPVKDVLSHQTQYFQFPLEVGKGWKTRYHQADYRRDISLEMKVVGIESVTTPAGVFFAYKIERTFSYVSGGRAVITQVYVTEHYFYSPETRSVVKYHYKLEYRSTGLTNLHSTVDAELISMKEAQSR
jgi:hypothetical protein